MSTVAVIGGGITGLAAAYQAMSDGHKVVLFEASPRLGGKVDEVSIDGTTFPTGPDAFLARRPEVGQLATELGLAEELTSPTARAARIFRNGVLHPLPPNVLGVPATADLTATGLISPEGAALAAAGTKEAATSEDESVGSLVRRQLGDEVLEFLVDPLLGGINAGDSDRLSLAAGVPQLHALHQREGRLLDAAADTLAEAARKADPAAPPAPVFHSIKGGIGRLIRALEESLAASDQVEFRLGTKPAVTPNHVGWFVDDDSVDHVISTIPAFAAAELISKIAPNAAQLLASIEYSSVALTIMTLAPGTIPLDETISGVLVPRTLGHHVTAISFASHKWPHLGQGGRQVLRVSVGRRTDQRWMQPDDDALTSIIEEDLSAIFDVPVEAATAKVTRWMQALPQYDVGHGETVRRIDDAASEVPGLHLTGAWHSGLGLPACVASGRRTARNITNTV